MTRRERRSIAARFTPLFTLLMMGGLLASVVGGSASCRGSSSVDGKNEGMNTNSAELKRFIRLPAEVKACEWQTGKFAKSGGDWWVAAVLDVDADQMDAFLRGPSKRELFETPPGLELKSSFSTLQSLPDAQTTDSGGVRVAVDTFSVAPYASSPLLNGSVLKLSAGRLLVVLWTR